MTKENNTKRNAIKFIAITGILSALAAVIQMFEIPLPMLIPSFVKIDFSEIPAILATFLVSPVSGLAVCLIKNLIHLFTTNSAGVGELANFILGACMVLPAGIIYKLKPTKGSAAIAMVVGSVISAVISIFVNYYITYPFYSNFMPMEAIIEAYKAINGGVGSLWDCLIWFNMPFTAAKFIIDSVVVFFIYKPLSKAVKNI
ncbi:MAG: ECF transporter S component [Ruminiclostridium sp.]